VKTLNNIYQIEIPQAASGLTKFDFTSMLGDISLLFNFWFFNNRWNCWVTLPSGEKRTIGIFTNNYCWSEYSDYSVIISFSNENIFFDDILDIGLFILQWN
jgi:hypothetical protein